MPSKLISKWSKWSLPTKISIVLGIISTVLGLPGFILYLAQNTKSTNEVYNRSAYYESFGKAMFYYSNMDYDKAKLEFQAARKKAPSEDLKDLVSWEGENLSRSGAYESSFTSIKTYYESSHKEPSQEEFNDLGVIRCVTLVNDGRFSDLRELLSELANQNYQIPLASDFEEATSVGLKDYSAADSLLRTLKFSLEENEPYRRLQYELWATLTSVFLGRADGLKSLIGLMFLERIDPEQFNEDYFSRLFPIYNLTFHSLTFQKKIQDLTDSVLTNISVDDRRILMKFENDFTRFGMHLGSFSCLKTFLQKNARLAEATVTKQIRTILSKETALSYEPLFVGEKLILLLVTAQAWQHGIDGVPEEFVGTVKLRTIEIISGDCKITEIREGGIDNPATFWHYGRAVNKPAPGFVFVTTQGSGHFKLVYFLRAKDLSFRDILPEEGVEKSYHATHTSIQDTKKGLLIRWNYELQNDCEPNIARKVNGFQEMELNKLDSLKITRRYYQNPGVQFFESLNVRQLKLQNSLMNQIQVQGKVISDKKFIKLLTGDEKPCYIRTKIDETYFYLSERLAPSISGLLIRFGGNMSEPREDGIEDYFILVRKRSRDVQILDIFRVQDSQISHSVLN